MELRVSRCRSCDAPVRWVTTERGKNMPLNPDPVENGNIELIQRDGQTIAVVHPAGHVDLFGGPRFVTHFTDCPSAAEWRREHGVPEPRFDGATVADDPDATPRLSSQLLAVHTAMSGGAWWTLAELAVAVGGSEAGVSARVRDLRKPRNGAHVVERRHVGGGVWQYRLVQPQEAKAS